ncbi:MAG: glucose-1-phosphate adenylyltransferase [Candidatus Krumholzibacteria bacterium]|nr:glucose-1-phosphate adenylyltransferase [Candidatus Krumholzibacteria bacterium]
MSDTTAVILGGGRGTRLYPLTRNRSKPAVPLAGNYRLIDVPVSNCINSGIDRIFVLTQFNSASLNQHVSNTYRFGMFSRGFVEIIAAEQTFSSSMWFQGTADAVRQAIPHVYDRPHRDVLILSGDHLYRMDYRHFIAHHRQRGADITIAVHPVDSAQARHLGILHADEAGRIAEFREKPRGKALAEMRTDTRSLGLGAVEARRRPYLGSMGIYLFRSEVLREILGRNPGAIDFAKEIIPGALSSLRVQAYLHEGYWRDIGTIRSFYDAHMDLLRPVPPLSLFDQGFPIYTHPRFLPGSKIRRGAFERSILNAGCIIDRATVRHSIIGLRSRIGSGALVEDSLVFGADSYQLEKRSASEGIPIGIGAKSTIRRAIVDKNARIGRRVVLENARRLRTYDDPEERFFVRNGIIVVPKDAVLPDGASF